MLKSVVITPKNESEWKFLSDLFQKLGLATKVFSREELEAAGLSLLMKKVDRSKRVSRSTILKKLHS